MSIDGNVVLYGTTEAPDRLKTVRLGPLSFVYTADAIRRICWHDVELVRAIAWPIRDASWGTYQPDILDEQVEESDGAFSAHVKFSVAEGRLTCGLKIQASESGAFDLDLSITPVGGPFTTNRAGFTVLHPIIGFAGAPLEVTHSDGAVEDAAFPRLISPGQPVFDIQGLRYGLDGRSVDIAFSGDVFEMEDQRNWSDASYKTYCVPLVLPFTYELGAPRSQSIRLVLAGEDTDTAAAAGQAPVTIQPAESTAPSMGLAVEAGWLENGGIVAASGVQHLVARIGPSLDAAFLARLADVAEDCALDLEVVIADGADPAAFLGEVRDAIGQIGLDLARIIALPEAYLGSHQPSGPWPDGTTPTDAVQAARQAFSGAAIGGGMLTNFTEFNRCPLDPDQCDFVTHANSAIVHAGDDLSICETLEALPQIFESTAALARGKSCHLGLVSIGMRTNPYGAELARNPAQVRHTMAHEDPRQRGLFAAAWAVGVLAATQAQPISSLCLGAPTGPFGVSYSKQSYRQAYFDDRGDAVLYPLFHVVRAAALMAGQPRLQPEDMPEGLQVYGAGRSFMISNPSVEPRTLRLGDSARIAVLNAETFVAATKDINWLRNTPRRDTTELTMEGYATAFADT